MSDWETLKWVTIAFAAVAVTALIAIVVLWLAVPGVRSRWLPLPRLRPGDWTGFEVVMTFCILWGVPDVVVGMLFQIGFFVPLFGPAPDLDAKTEAQAYLQRCSNTASPLIYTIMIGMILLVLFARTRTRPHNYGLSWGRWAPNLALGLTAFIIVTPIVFAVFAPISMLFPDSEHAMTVFGRQGLEGWEWTLLAFQLTVAAPFAEELIFRGIVQGWLRRATLRGHLTTCVLTIFVVLILIPSTNVIDYIAPLVFTAALVGGYGYLLYRLAKRFHLDEIEVQTWEVEAVEPSLEATVTQGEEELQEQRQRARQDDETRREQWAKANAELAIFGSAMLFAAVHSRVWPTPVPLFVFGLAAGWLARRTQSLIAPIALHALFNLVSFIALYATALQNGNVQAMAVRPSVVGSTTISVPASQLPLRK